MLIPLLLQLAGMTFAVLVDSYISRQHKRVMLSVAALVFSLIAQNYVENLLVTGEPRVFLRTFVAIYGYSVRPVILVLFLYTASVRPGRTPRRRKARIKSLRMPRSAPMRIRDIVCLM